MRASKRRFCSFSLDSSQILMSFGAVGHDLLFDAGADLEELITLFLRAEAQNVLRCAVVLTPVKNYDFAFGRSAECSAAYICDFASDGAGKATTRNTRTEFSVIALTSCPCRQHRALQRR